MSGLSDQYRAGKGLVLEVRGRDAIILDSEGRFRKVRTRDDEKPGVGDVLTLSPPDRSPVISWMSAHRGLFAAAAMIFLLILGGVAAFTAWNPVGPGTMPLATEPGQPQEAPLVGESTGPAQVTAPASDEAPVPDAAPATDTAPVPAMRHSSSKAAPAGAQHRKDKLPAQAPVAQAPVTQVPKAQATVVQAPATSPVSKLPEPPRPEQSVTLPSKPEASHAPSREVDAPPPAPGVIRHAAGASPGTSTTAAGPVSSGTPALRSAAQGAVKNAILVQPAGISQDASGDRDTNEDEGAGGDKGTGKDKDKNKGEDEQSNDKDQGSKNDNGEKDDVPGNASSP